MTQEPKPRDRILSLVSCLEFEKGEAEKATATYMKRVQEAETETRLLITQAELAFREYEDSGRKDATALARADERYITYRILFDALPMDSKKELGLRKLPTDSIDYLVQK